MKQKNHKLKRRGMAAVLAMMFLTLMATLTLAMFSMSSSNVQTAGNFSDVVQAQAAAEAGVRWMAYRFVHMNRPKTTIGNITPTVVATTLWPALRQAIVDDISNPGKSGNAMQDAAEQPVTVSADGSSVTTSAISTETGGASFVVVVKDNAADATTLNVTSTGTFNNTTRAVTMNFKVDKKINFAVVGRVPVQLGRNVIVEGNVAVATTTKYPPIQMLSDFTWFDSALGTKIANFQTWLAANHTGYDGRVNVNNATELAAATKAGYSDVNGDGYIDEYDLYLKQYDKNSDKQITQTEFTNASTGKLYDPNLFNLIDNLNGPMFVGDPPRAGLADNIVSNADGYAKIRGTLTLAMTAQQWTSELSGSGTTISNFIQGPITPTDPGDVPVTFGADPTTQMLDLSPQNFQQCAANLQAQSGAAAGAKVQNSTNISNTTLTVAMANGTSVTEESPKGSNSFQAVYKRPVFKNLTLTNVQIPQGLNALFQNCKFQGVTFVNTQSNIVDSSGNTTTDDPNAGMSWAERATSGSSTVITSGTFTTNSSGKVTAYRINGMTASTTITSWDSSGNPILPAGAGSFAYGTGSTDKKSLGSVQGNNLRFDGCEFDGPIAGNYATDYTHFSNSWEFTGATTFSNQWVDSSGQTTATIVSPQVNIEMGSFTNPGAAVSTLLGVVVAGNIDIRGTSKVDGSIIVTGNGAGNTTLGYFGPDDSQSNPSALPTGGYGQLDIRYNPYRALPDGINIAITVLPVSGSYSENVTLAD